MNYYDNVKDSVRGDDSSEEDKSNFETLREAAEGGDQDEEEEGDDTEIEVLEEGLGGKRGGSPQKQTDRDGSREQKSTSGSAADLSSVEEKLDRIIEQNARMIEILESFGS